MNAYNIVYKYLIIFDRIKSEISAVFLERNNSNYGSNTLTYKVHEQNNATRMVRLIRKTLLFMVSSTTNHWFS